MTRGIQHPANLAAGVTKDDLDALADGQLLPDRLALVTDYVAAYPEAAARVAGVRALNGLLRQLGPPEDPPPDQLVAAVKALAAALTGR